MCIEELNNYFIIRLGMVSVLGTGSPTLTGCKEKEVGVSHVHPLRWASPHDVTATLGFDSEGFPAGHFIHPHGWFLILDTGFIICSAFARGW